MTRKIANLEIKRIYSEENIHSKKILQKEDYSEIIKVFNVIKENLEQSIGGNPDYRIELVYDGYEKKLYLTDLFYFSVLIISVTEIEEVSNNPMKELEREINIFLDDTNTSEMDYQIKF